MPRPLIGDDYVGFETTPNVEAASAISQLGLRQSFDFLLDRLEQYPAASHWMQVLKLDLALDNDRPLDEFPTRLIERHDKRLKRLGKQDTSDRLQHELLARRLRSVMWPIISTT